MALYRKYRPATFAEVVGQEHVTDPLSTALDTGRISHAYLFSGPRGCGKTSSARILARSLNCADGPTSTPCGTCPSCIALGPGGPGNLDVIELDAASHGGVDDTRELRDRAFYAPAESRYRVFIVDEAHMVTTAGFNALLKIVEEPPAHLIFIFATTEPDKVLPTIRSRTHHYPFRLLPPATMRGLLGKICDQEQVPVEEAVYPLVIRAGGGSPRDSLSVLDQLLAGAGPEGVTYSRAVSLLGVTDVALIDDAIGALAGDDGAALFGTVDRVVEAGHDPRRFAVDLLERLRDLILMRAVPDAVDRGLVSGPGDVLDRMREQAERLGPATLTRYAELLHEALGEMRGATSPRLLLEVVCARMLLPSVSDAESATLQRLERLERGFAGGAVPPAAPATSAAPAAAATPAPAPAAAADPNRRRGAEALAAIRREAAGKGGTAGGRGEPVGAPAAAPARGAVGAHAAGPGDSGASGSPASSGALHQEAAGSRDVASTQASAGASGDAALGDAAAHGSAAGVAQGLPGGVPAGSAAASDSATASATPGRDADSRGAQGEPGTASGGRQAAAPAPAQRGEAAAQQVAGSAAGAATVRPGQPDDRASAGEAAPRQAVGGDSGAAAGAGAEPEVVQSVSSSAPSSSAQSAAVRTSGVAQPESVRSGVAQSSAEVPGSAQSPAAEAQSASVPSAVEAQSDAAAKSELAQPLSSQPDQAPAAAHGQPVRSGAVRDPAAVQPESVRSHAQARSSAAAEPEQAQPPVVTQPEAVQPAAAVQAGQVRSDAATQAESAQRAAIAQPDQAQPAAAGQVESTQPAVVAPVEQAQPPVAAQVESVQPPAAAQVDQVQPAAAVQAESGQEGDLLREVEAAWGDIRAKVREFGAAVQAMLAGASVARIEGEVIVFAHQHAPLAQRLSDPRNVTAVRSAVRAVLGRELDVRWEAGGAASRPAAAQRASTQAKPQRAAGQPAGREAGNAGGRGPDAPPPPRFSRPSQAKNAAVNKPRAFGDDDIPPPDYPDLPDDPGPFDGAPAESAQPSAGSDAGSGWSADRPVPVDTPEDEEEMIRAAAVPVAPEDRRDPDEVALELLKSELGATRLSG
ncbi:DNA polymerase III subunit gamma and tau [Nocardia brasiliensis]|uniref:DNA polymerase III subunit gamma and tau n=1 Tax=Nocardia brasiliensis TaxID=37326 RepID=UPI001EEC496B|nr:DNA polymerase III subunit gamma and tau [Nocardia brasiliensis]